MKKALFQRCAGAALAYLSLAAVIYGICAARSQAIYCRERYGHTPGTAVPMAEAKDAGYPVRTDAIPGVLDRCETAHRLYPHNYRLCTFASDVAFLGAIDCADEETGSDLRSVSWEWCERGLLLNGTSRDLHLRKTGLLEETDREAALEWWKRYVDEQHYWEPYNHHVLAVLYARLGRFEDAERCAHVIEKLPYHGRTLRFIEEARSVAGADKDIRERE
jgi:hypothetical protein